MLRSIFVTIGSLLLILLLYALAPLLLIGVVAALLFGIGSLLTRVFAVTTFEATLVATVIAIPLMWFYYRLLQSVNLLGADPAVPQEEPSAEFDSIEPLIIMPRRPSRRSKRGSK